MLELNVQNMTCGHCVNAVTRALKAVDPMASVDIDLETKRVRIESRQPPEVLTKALDEAGYPAR